MRTIPMMAVTVATLACLAGPASAHAAYKSSDPPDEGRVSSPPSQVTATFTEPLANGSYLQITDPCGERVDEGDVRIVGYDMSVSMNGAAAGAYAVYYKAFSTLDPHVTDGTFGFTATSGEPCAGAVQPDESTNDGAEDDGQVQAVGESGSDDPSAGGSGRSSSDGGSGDTDVRSAATTERDDRSGSARGNRASDDRSSAGPGDPTLAVEQDPRPEPSVWDGIRLEPFLTGLLLAAIVGAAGGKIYAGIMGPRA